jgi:hypothetical protein
MNKIGVIYGAGSRFCSAATGWEMLPPASADVKSPDK